MITRDAITEAATKHHTSEMNVAREYVQHVFLKYLYANRDAGGLLFKGGTALRLVYKSPRFSEDLDFSSYGLTVPQIEGLFLETLAVLEKQGFAITLHERSHQTSGGYYGEARVDIYGHRVTLEINVHTRDGAQAGEYKLVIGDFAPNYGLQMLPEAMLVSEKLQALRSRKKPRDFYDLYFMLRAGMIPAALRTELRDVLPIVEATTIAFRQELGIFLPADAQSLVKDFKTILVSEMRRSVG